MTFTYGAGSRVATAADSLGRTVTFGYDDGLRHYDEIGFSGFGGAARTVRVWYDTLEQRLRPGSGYDLRTFYGLFPLNSASRTTQYNPTNKVSAVELPDGRRYELYYNPYGELARVELPTGGAIEYDWEGGADPADATLLRYVTRRRVYPEGGSAWASQTEYVRGLDGPNSTVEERTTDPGGTLLARALHYFHGDALESMAPDPARPAAISYGKWREGREYRTDVFDVVDGAPVLRQVVARTWRQPLAGQTWPLAGPGEADEAARPNVARVAKEETTLSDTNQVSKRAFAYDRYGNATDEWEYDYGAGESPAYATRRTHTDYLTTNVIGGTTYDYACDPATTCSNASIDANVIHQRGLARARQVYAVNTSTGAEILTAKSETRYDEADYPLLTYDGIAVPGWANPATPARGNATSVRGYADATALLQPGQACPAGVCVETHARYDQLGNVRLSWDAKGNRSEVLYGDSYCNGGACGGGYVPNTFAFPTAMKSPKPDPSGTYGSAAELTSSTVYDFHTGLVYSSTDANNQTTRYEYADPLDRPTAAVRPDADRPAGVRTDVYYSQPQEASLYVRTLADLDGTRRLKSEQYFDRMGRPSRSFTWENQDTDNPWLTADTHYDALGRAWRTSNPYRSAGPGGTVDAGRAGVETTFDALGRVRQVKTTADGAAVRTDYSGSRVLVTDQAGRQRISKVDALGRLTEVWEVTPNDPAQYPGVESIPAAVTAGLPAASAYGYRTEYSYDAAGNLRRVKQGTQQRFFAYDSLGRLVRARNPEQDAFAAGGDFPALNDPVSGNQHWSAGYVYDANGNLTKRRDARGTVTTYGYDALNRNVTVSYALGGQTAATPNVSRYYDNHPAAGANGKGRLWRSEAFQTAQTTVDRYDEAGRPAQQTQKFWGDTDWRAQAYTTELTYNLAGGVTELVYPSRHRAYYQYDEAGRLGDHGQLPAFRGTLGDGAEKVYASQVRYDELGGMSQERFGTDTPVYNKRFYNARGQLSEIKVSTYAITNTDQGLRTNWNRGAIINRYSTATGGGPDNNGNLRGQDIFIPKTEGAGYDQAANHDLFSQGFDYDALNRLTRVSEGGRWRQEYAYDRWGNRTINAAATQVYEPGATYTIPEPQFAVDQGTNRLGVPAGQAGQMNYDADGNLINDSYSPGSYGSTTGQQTRFYDAEGRMTSAGFVSGQAQTASYVYDADGRRVKLMVGTEAEAWQVYGAGGELLAEYAPGAAREQPRKEYGYRGGELLVTASPGAASPTPTPAQRVNVAAASQGATASASSSYDQYGLTASKAINGSRTASGSYWNDGASSSGIFPDDLEVTFAGSKTIGEVDLYFLQDNNATAEPTEGMTFTQYGVTKFEVQYLSGGGWVTVPGGLVEGNNRVWRKVTFPAVTADKIRVRVNGASDVWSRVVEVEAYEAPKNVAAASNGATATASSSYADYGLTPEKAINGSRTGAGSYWNDSTPGVFTTPGAEEYLQVNFAGAKTIGEVDVFFLQDGNGTAEPTEAMTCTQYGLVKFDVQYRQGTQWVTVPGGGVTGNNKVWRKLTFAPVTTDAVRVLVHGSADVWSRVVEVEAYEGTAAPAATDVRWLVTDHLGTPRMVVDRTGSLGGVSRHDYIPFGEELFAGVGGRATTQGYTAVDNTRQKFTGKERDGETGLDYFGARYFSSSQGRFLGADDFSKDSHIGDPQSWNKYCYVRNNPLKLVDPTGEKAHNQLTIDEEHKRGLITISATFGVYAAKGNQMSRKELTREANRLRKRITDAWSTSSYERNGITYEVKVNVKVNVYNSESAAEAAGAAEKVDNIIGIIDAPFVESPDGERGGGY
ncbi:MAG TPA: RHS repeat-associated core domain-containing protein, partial [Pyrinomonadaceae bacterium]